jgi:hypothetical protein
MFGLFKPKPWQTTYDQPLLLAVSDLPGFKEFIQIGGTSTLSSKIEIEKSSDTLHYIKLILEEEIPAGILYFKYIGNGQIIQCKKYDLEGINNKKTSLPSLSIDAETRILDHSSRLGDFSPRWKKDELMNLVFQLRQQKTSNWLKNV